jgi:type I restriction enzyme S subunit
VVPDDIPVSVSTKHLATITMDRGRVHPVFLSHAIYSDPSILGQIAAANRGAIMAGLNLGLIKRLKIRVPPLSVQNRFADVVAKASAMRVSLMSAASQAEALFDSLAQQAFAGRR